MASFNRVIMMGNLTRDPDYKQLSSGQSVCRLGLASNRQFKNRQTGAMVQEVCYVDIDVWGAQADSCNQYLQKGRPILVEGRLKFDTWEDQQGNTRNKHFIVADRVVFLSAQSSAEFAGQEKPDYEKPASKSTVDTKLEKNLLDQIESIKVKAEEKKQAAAKPKRTVAKKEDDLPTVDFKDTPPFEDNLPF